jgi:hypothetical protein
MLASVAVAVAMVFSGSFAHADDGNSKPAAAPEGENTKARPVRKVASLVEPLPLSTEQTVQPTADQPTRAVAVARPPDGDKLGAPLVPGWILRPVIPGTAMRLDTTAAPATTDGQTAVDTVSFLSGSYKVAPNFAIGGRFGAFHYEPVKGDAQDGVTNLMLNGQYGTPVGSHFHVAAVLGVSAPIGSGSGNSPDPNMTAALIAGRYSRAGMDNTIFFTNYLGFVTGADVAYHYRRFTTQAEVSVSPLVRVQGALASPDTQIVAASAGWMAGYFLLPRLSAAAEARDSTVLTTPVAIEKDPSARNNLSFAAGFRGYFALTDKVSFRPGVSYGTGIYGKVADLHYQFVQVDLPVVF